MQPNELSAEEKILILDFLKRWFVGFSSIAILIFGGVGAILLTSITGIGKSTAIETARHEIDIEIEILRKYTDDLKKATADAEKRFYDNVSSLEDYRSQSTETIQKSIIEIELSKQKVKSFLSEVESSRLALQQAKDLTKDISSISMSLSRDKNFISQVSVDLATVPKNAVVAFNSKCPTSGWDEYIPGKGRFIVGIGESPGLTEKSLQQTGGEESVSLDLSQIPPHSHNYNDWHYYDSKAGTPDYGTGAGDDAGQRRDTGRTTTEAGKGKSHNNMPPFIALKYCIKN